MAVMLEESTAAGLIEGYRQQVALYNRMFQITRQQTETLDNGADMRRFIDLLEEKEDIIRTIDKLENGLAPLKRTWQDTPESEKKQLGESTDRLNELLDNVIVLIEKIIRTERDNEKTLQSQRDELSDEIAQIDTGKRMHKAFAPRPAPRFMDTCS